MNKQKQHATTEMLELQPEAKELEAAEAEAVQGGMLSLNFEEIKTPGGRKPGSRAFLGSDSGVGDIASD